MMNKKALLVLIVSVIFFNSNAQAKDYSEAGKKLLKNGFESTGIAEVEKYRMPIRTTFEAAYEIYMSYNKKAFASKEYNSFYKFAEGKNEKEIKAEFDKLPNETQVKIKEAESANSEISSSIGKLLLNFTSQNLAFQEVDTKSALGSLGMFKMPSALSAVGDTFNEVEFILDSVGEIHRVSEMLSRWESAQ